jgi:hypothetical protein
MGRLHDDHIAPLLMEADGCLRAGRYRDAEQAFGRLLLLDAHHAAARAGHAKAAAALAEEQRHLDASLAEARALWGAGRPVEARALLDEVLLRGGDRDAALALLDRMTHERGPAHAAMQANGPNEAPAVVLGKPLPRRVWRRVLATAWLALFLLLGVGVASAWDELVGRLTDLPGARSAAPASVVGVPTPGEQALRLARRALERDDPATALAALADVTPDDPVYPMSEQIRAQAKRAAGERGRR